MGWQISTAGQYMHVSRASAHRLDRLRPNPYIVRTENQQGAHPMTAMPYPASVSTRAAKRARLDLRLSAEQKLLFEEAASATDRTMTEFVVQSAEVAAQEVLADRTRFVLAPEEWEAFSTAIDSEPRVLPRLAAFLTTPSVLERE